MKNEPLQKVAELPESQLLYTDVCHIIDETRTRVAVYVNAEICHTNWLIGKRIKEDILYNKRAEYGKQVVKNLSARLTEKYGRGWSDRTLLHCIRAAYTFTEEEIVYAVRRQFSWTHLRSSQTLGETEEKQMLVPDLVFRSSYFLDALGLPDMFSEKDLESAIITQMQEFLNEMGTDFAFLARQKRITIDATDYYIDLLFYHQGLRRLVAIDLKLGKFKPEHEGQMRLYLRYLNQNERREGEESPIGLILCSEGNTEHIEYLMLDEDSPIKVAQYYTQLPDRKVLAEKLQRAIAIAREHYTEQHLQDKETE